MEFKFEVNQKYTVVADGERNATIRSEIVIRRFDVNKQRYIFRIKGQRKEYYIPSDIDKHLLFKGHGLPFLVDTETIYYANSVGFVFVTDDPAPLKAFIETNCLNLTDEKRRSILISGTDRYDLDALELRPLFK